MNARYELVRLLNGTFSVRSLEDQEIFHPVAGPLAEAEALYVRQLQLHERCRAASLHRQHSGASEAASEFVIWDVGLGAGGNALTAIRQLRDADTRVRVLSFDRTAEALRFALTHAGDLQFPRGFEHEIAELLATSSIQFTHGSLRVVWEIHLGDFSTQLAGARQRDLPAPHAIFFDAFSPARNPDMWTLGLFQNLFRCLDPRRPCSLATFSRSTAARVSMLLSGFFVGVGEAVAGKEETTIAANTLELIDRPLDSRWIDRAKISRNAEPLREPRYSQQPLSPETLEQLRAHPQFA